MNIHPILLRGLLTAVVAEITAEQRELLCSVDGGVMIVAEDYLVNRITFVIAAVESDSD
ncbi:hypothetical protein [Novosphingobium kaempferiae]|uniref:hypothetical protein n=1 Tax=Novosphingobium kaempferiae TaxID=2896849 RepID=UPI001E5C8DE3|nr:hypothetical protein [Novosphingobium kaempferiae]